MVPVLARVVNYSIIMKEARSEGTAPGPDINVDQVISRGANDIDQKVFLYGDSPIFFTRATPIL